MTSMHELEELRAFYGQHVDSVYQDALEVEFESGHGPKIICEVYQFKPRTPELLRQLQYVKNSFTGKYEAREERSPPLAMQLMENRDVSLYDSYLDLFVEHHLPGFPRCCFADEPDNFQPRLLALMCELYHGTANEKKPFLRPVLHSVLRLVVATYIMGHTLNLSDNTKDEIVRRLGSPREKFGRFCSPRMANRQLKFLFSFLHRKCMKALLSKIQNILRHSKVRETWVLAFCAVLGLGMVDEEVQKTIHIIMNSRWTRRQTPQADAEWQAQWACEAIDKKFEYITDLFRRKYNSSSRSMNPLANYDHTEVAQCLGGAATDFVRRVHALVVEKGVYHDHAAV
ncbi:hypothetical protein B0A49_03729 [Cryomyces minteri]|uniref:Uncharacterized protein n=1 Tax=Cryomyces minteri TaxID=331657 RepID=A0A4U0XMU8_9PEZI|nr:hypothetical protein B0A49_03729 [Cryomyces minteri]